MWKNHVDCRALRIVEWARTCDQDQTPDKEGWNTEWKMRKGPHKCDLCNTQYKRIKDLNDHMQIHGGVKLSCKLCKYSSNSKHCLTRHIRRRHKGAFCFRCNQCRKSFMTQQELADHIPVHLGLKTFVCDICGNAFISNRHLRSHRTSVHFSVKKFKCHLCKKKFVSQENADIHATTTHSKTFLCELCDRIFISKHLLKLHTWSHAGERLYRCEVCNKSFASSFSLITHELVHTGERPYACDLCEEAYTRRKSLLLHRRKLHGDLPPPPRLLLTKVLRKNKI